MSIRRERMLFVCRFVNIKLRFFVISDTDIATAVAWAPDNQLISCSDDKIICRWTSEGEVAGKISSVSAFVTAVSWFPVIGKQV